MNELTLLIPIVLPSAAAVLALLAYRKTGAAVAWGAVLVTLANLVLAAVLFGQERTYAAGWNEYGIQFILRLYHFSSVILLASAGFSFLVALYSVKFMRGRPHLTQYYAYLLISLAMVNGAVLADNLVMMLFFWEGLLLTLFGLIAIGRPGAWKTATKAFVIVGISDLCMMFGMILAGHLGGTLQMSQLHVSAATALGGLAMILMMIGAMAKAGAVPFHTWIPDAAIDAPLPFMAFLPASLEKLLGIYFLARITLDFFALSRESWLSIFLMIIGAVTILLAVLMALVQKDYKRLLSYHAISQVGYMVLGIGTAVPIGIVGGLFHMLNHSMYKSCLFLTGGSVEKQAGTTDLSKLGGIGSKMPITFICFLVAAASISGVPPFNGFFSKELIYDGALERGWVFYAAALLGSLLTAASFLKLGHAAFLGKRNPENDGVKEAPLSMLTPMILIAAGCVLFGVYNPLPLRHLIQPIVAGAHDYSGLPTSAPLVAGTVIVLILALLNHLYGVKRSGSGLGAADHIHYAPVLSGIYDKAEKRYFDPYNIGTYFSRALAGVLWGIDRVIDWIYDTVIGGTIRAAGASIRLAHTGSYALYVLWSLVGVAAAVWFVAVNR